MSDEIATLESEISELERQLLVLRTNLAAYQQTINLKWEQVSKLYEARDTLILNSRGPNPVIDLDIIFTPNHKSRVMYEEAQRQAASLGLRLSGYYTESNQTQLEVALIQTNPEHTERVYQSLKALIPHIRPVKIRETLKGELTGKPIEIFDHRLAADGGWTLLVKGDTVDSPVWLVNRYYKDQEFSNLKEALVYCQKYHYYEVE